MNDVWWGPRFRLGPIAAVAAITVALVGLVFG